MSSKMSTSEAGKLGAIKSTMLLRAQKEQRIIEYNKEPILCRSCDRPLTYDDMLRKKKFHNSSCAAIFNNTKKKKYLNMKTEEMGRQLKLDRINTLIKHNR